MQINTLGSGHNHNSHNVTNCIHQPDAEKNIKGGAAADSNAVAQSTAAAETLSGEGFSLSAWMKNTLGGGKKLLMRVWGEDNSSNAAGTAAEAAKDGQEQLMAQVGDAQIADRGTRRGKQDTILPDSTEPVINSRTATAASVVATATATLPQPQQPEQTYFAAVEEDTRGKSVWERVKVKFQAITGQLSRNPSGRDSFQAKQEHQRDLRKRSRYHGENEEIDCILTDDSYLLDSYNRKGGYSQLTTKK